MSTSTVIEFSPDPMTPWLTRREAAARARVSVWTINAAVRSGELRHSRLNGRNVVIHVDWLDRWLVQRARKRRPS